MNFFKRIFGYATTDYEPLEDESENKDSSCQRPCDTVKDNLEDNILHHNTEDKYDKTVSVNFHVLALLYNL